jgi:predicted ATPase
MRKRLDRRNLGTVQRVRCSARPSVRIRDDGGSWRQAYDRLASFDSMMTYCSDPGNGLELLLLRERLRDWRFYDHFRTDIEAPARRPQVGTYTPVLASDGADLAAPMQTIREIGDSAALDDAVADAFDGARIDVTGDRGYLELEMRQHGLLRSLKAAELSDGTLLSPRPPTLMILNEPETSLHQDLLAPLARLVAGAASRSQIFVVTHARPLAESLLAEADCRLFVLGKELGETVIAHVERPTWTWPTR